MFFIFEGPDGSGKTTLARDLERQGWRYHHEGPPPVPCPSLIEHYAQLLLSVRQPTVFDRLFLGEVIYGPLLRGHDKIGGQVGVDMLNQLVWALGGRTIIFLPGLETSWLNMKSRKGELVKAVEDHAKVYNAYCEYADDENMDYGKYDYKTDFGHSMGPPRLPKGMVGHHSARVVLVGDVANSATLDLPFFAEDGSSGYLRECLRRAGYHPRDYILVNANKIDGTSWKVADMVEEFWHPENRPEIVALGNNAYEAAYDVVNHKLNHPAYQKRFKSTETVKYIEQLSKILERTRTPRRSLA